MVGGNISDNSDGNYRDKPQLDFLFGLGGLRLAKYAFWHWMNVMALADFRRSACGGPQLKMSPSALVRTSQPTT